MTIENIFEGLAVYKSQFERLINPDHPRVTRETFCQLLSLADQVSSFAEDVHKSNAFNFAAELYSGLAGVTEDRFNDPNQARRLYRLAAVCYNKAAEIEEQKFNNPSSSSESDLDESRWSMICHQYTSGLASEQMLRLARRARKNAALYKVTENMNPIKRWVVRKIKSDDTVPKFKKGF